MAHRPLPAMRTYKTSRKRLAYSNEPAWSHIRPEREDAHSRSPARASAPFGAPGSRLVLGSRIWEYAWGGVTSVVRHAIIPLFRERVKSKCDQIVSYQPPAINGQLSGRTCRDAFVWRATKSGYLASCLKNALVDCELSSKAGLWQMDIRQKASMWLLLLRRHCSSWCTGRRRAGGYRRCRCACLCYCRRTCLCYCTG
jgi:hypothetical protein